MKSNPEASSEYTAFSGVLAKVLKVSHAELQSKLEAEKKQKKPAPKRASSSDRASADKD